MAALSVNKKATNKASKPDLSALQPLLTDTGVLDHFPLPQKVAQFLRRYQFQIWACIICVIVIAVSSLSYSAYITHRHSKAAQALENAFDAPSAEQKEALLLGVLDGYEKTPSAMLASIALSRLKEEAGDKDKAIACLENLRSQLGAKASIRPMLLTKLAVLYEDSKNYDKALALYGEVTELKMPNLVTEAKAAMGRIYERTGKTAEAIAAYQKYLESSISTLGQGNANSPQRDVIQFRLSQLQKQ